MRSAACSVLLASCLAAARVQAGEAEIRETLNVIWEVFWQQQGYLQYVAKWREPIRVRFSGVSSHRQFALEQLRRVGRAAGIEVSEADAAGPANLEVEFIRDDPSRVGGLYFPCRAVRTPPAGTIRHVKIVAEERWVRRCFLHEAMHAMGMAGHPGAGSVLSYYRSSNELTRADQFLLKVWYSDEVMPGMFPLPALKVFARRLVEAAPEGPARQEAERVASQFQREVLEQLESIALGKGEPPRTVFRSSTSTTAGLERGRTEALFLLGMAYSYGHAVEVDPLKGTTLLAAAAAYSHREAQVHLGHAYRLGRGIEADAVEAYKWYLLAAQKGSPVAKAEAGRLEKDLSAEEAAEGRSRMGLWKPASREASATQTDR